ncbi:MAG: hypothetical protein ABSE44_13460 [Candidatus Sulfotelmatobacter sp.]|jgi:hypothetical protein
MADTVFEFTFNNKRKKRLPLSIEPWGDVLQIEPGQSLRMRVQGPISENPNQCLTVQVEGDDSASVWGWTGSSITVLAP